MLIKYALRALLSLAAKLTVWTFGWLMAAFCYRAEETRVTGYPSQFPGKLREHIDWPFQWASTFDDCADAHWYSGRMRQLSLFGWQPFSNTSEDQYQASAWLRYVARVLWLYRNPAYTISRDLGFDQTGLEITTHSDESALWDAGYPNTTYRTFTNAYGQRGFLYERQIHLGFQWFFEMVLGHKVPWLNERKNRAMVAVRFTIKRYPKQEV